jgi:hypothetical protein
MIFFAVFFAVFSVFVTVWWHRFGGKATAWRPTMVKPTAENLQEAWK